MAKASRNWKVLNWFSRYWSQAHDGEVYPRSGRDLRASKALLELYPDFDDPATAGMLTRRLHNYLHDMWWDRPHSTPVLRHQFCYFVEFLDRYNDQEALAKRRKQIILIRCADCGTPHEPHVMCPNPGCPTNRILVARQTN